MRACSWKSRVLDNGKVCSHRRWLATRRAPTTMCGARSTTRYVISVRAIQYGIGLYVQDVASCIVSDEDRQPTDLRSHAAFVGTLHMREGQSLASCGLPQ